MPQTAIFLNELYIFVGYDHALRLRFILVAGGALEDEWRPSKPKTSWTCLTGPAGHRPIVQNEIRKICFITFQGLSN